MLKVEMLAGGAASFKGGRTYVHGTDVLPFVESCAAVQALGAAVESIEFHTPLATRGVLVIDPPYLPSGNQGLNAHGMLLTTEGVYLPFVIFASPIAVDPIERTFDEASIWSDVLSSEDGSCLRVGRSSLLSAAEHLSSLMKFLCSTLLPQHKRWWFVRLKKNCTLPLNFSAIEIRHRRTIARRMVLADFSFDGVRSGQIEFVGART